MSKLINKVSITVVALTTVLSLSGATALIPATVHGATVEEQIATLMAQIQLLQSQLAAASGTSASSAVPASLLSSSDLTVGSKGAAVKDLQVFLNANNYMVATTGAGSAGYETEYFGNATKAALAKYQAAQGISPAAGYFGKLTKAKLSAMFAAAAVTPAATTPAATTPAATTPAAATGTGLSAALASAQPTGTLAPKNAARVPFTTVTLTAGSSDVTVNSLTVQRNGVAMDAAFSGLVLVDDSGLQIGDAKTLNSNHQANIGSPFVIKAGSSKTVTVAANMASSLTSYDGQVASFSVVAINTADNSAFTGLPLSGISLRLVHNITLGTVTTAVSSYDPASANSQQIGTTGYKFAALRVTAGSAEKVKLMSVRFNQSGSVSATDLANVAVYVDGTAYNTVVDSTGKYYTATFGAGLLIDKGLAKDVWIQGDIIGTNATNRTIQFDIYKTTDVYMTGDTYGYGIIPSAGLGTYDSTHATSQLTTSNPWFQSARITIAAGSATAVSKALSVPAQNIAVNVPNQVLGGFDTDIKGEALSVQTMKFTIASSSGSGTGLLTSVSLYQGNTVVAGPVDAVYASATTQTVTFSETVTIPVRKTTYTIKGKVASTINNGTQYAVTTDPSAGDWTNVTGVTTGNAISLSSIGSLTMSTVTVKGAALAVHVDPKTTAQTVVANKQSHTFANIQLDAQQSGEDVRLSVIPLYSTGSTTDMTSCQLFDGAVESNNPLTTGSNVWTATTLATASTKHSFTLDNALTITKGTSKNISVVCNLKASLATGNVYKWGIGGTIADDWSAVTGVTSGTSVGVTGTVHAGYAMTIGAASLTVSKDVSSPSYALAYSGQTGVIMGVLKFYAGNEDMTIQEIGLKLTNTASSSASDLTQVTLWDMAPAGGGSPAEVGTVTFSGVNTVASTSALSLIIPANTNKIITVKVGMGRVGPDLAGTEGALLAVDLASAQATSPSTSRLFASGNAAFDGVRLFRSIPHFTQLPGTSSSLITATLTLYKFSVTASPFSENGITLNALTVNVATSTGSATAGTTTVTNLKLFACKDSGFSGTACSSPVSGATNSATGQVGSTLTDLSTTNKFSIPNSVILSGTTYLNVIGNVAITNGTGTFSGSVTTGIASDSAYPSLSTLMAATSTLSASNIIWSPNKAAATPASETDLDWTNGYSLTGLTSMSNVTISK